jgi:hypothetical protein
MSRTAAQKMYWASGRETSRVEDTAYCLLSLFGINMPLLYGKGKKAFQRLQEEIMKTDADESLFARHLHEGQSPRGRDLLAASPSRFHRCSGAERTYVMIGEPSFFVNETFQLEIVSKSRMECWRKLAGN